jgi:uncharacterized protein (TIGR03790 family)
MSRSYLLAWFAAVLAILPNAAATSPERTLVVVNRGVQISEQIAEYYVHRREIPDANVCRIRAPRKEQITRREYDAWVEPGVRECLAKGDLKERIAYIVTTKGVPLKISGDGNAAVDSELTLLYDRLNGKEHPLEGKVANPFFGQPSATFDKTRFGMYLVTRLTGYDLEDVKGLIDRAQQAQNRGFVVIDGNQGNAMGERALVNAARILPGGRVHYENESSPTYDVRGVIGYAAWGSNDRRRLSEGRRDPGLEWLPGGIATEFVSTDGRTFEEPPKDWRPASWEERGAFWRGSPQSLTADFIHQGATGASGHVYEPKLDGAPQPDILFPAYLQGRTLAESFYLSIRYLSWMNVVVGDPLCTLGPLQQ